MQSNLKHIILLIIIMMGNNGMSKGIEFKNISFEEAMLISQSEGKPLFIDFYTEWCGPCKYLNDNVFIDESLGNYYNSNFISIQINGDSPEGLELKKKHEVSAFPAMLFLDTDYKMIKKVIGVRETDQLLKIGNLVINPESTKLFQMNQTYENGERDSKFIVEYINVLKKNYYSSVEVALTFIQNEKVNLLNKNDIIILIEARVGLDNSYVRSIFSDINKYTALHPELMKKLVLNIALEKYGKAVNSRNINIINHFIPELIEAYQIAVDSSATSENLISKLNELYQFKI